MPTPEVPPAPEAVEHAQAPQTQFTIVMPEQAVARIASLAPPGRSTGDVILHALRLYESLAQVSNRGFSVMRLFNPQTGEGLELGGDFRLK